jgi:glycerophosphoryl diester phosphodiesterase
MTKLLPSLIAHRGASDEAPENTLAAARLAWEQHADGIELDLHLTADGELVVMHDPDVLRTTGQPGAVAQLSLAQIRRLDAGSWKDPRFAGERVPTLAEMLGVTPKPKLLYVELKDGTELIPTLAAMAESAVWTLPAIAFIAFDAAVLRAVKQRLPQFPAYLLAETSGAPSLAQLIAECRRSGFQGLNLEHSWALTPVDLEAVRSAGLELHAWGVDDLERARRWIRWGAASLTTDRPGWLRQQLA